VAAVISFLLHMDKVGSGDRNGVWVRTEPALSRCSFSGGFQFSGSFFRSHALREFSCCTKC